MKFTYSDIGENCTLKEYINQYSPIKLEVGKTYVQAKETWHEKHYKIIFSDAKIAIGVVVYNAISDEFLGDYELFNVNNGFKYQDSQRPDYRLTEEAN